MKKQLILALVIAVGMLTAASLVTAGLVPGTGIKQTSHDLSSATGKGALYDAGVAADPLLDRICIYCHAPHHTITADEAVAEGINYYPLWNHDITDTTIWQVYQNTDMNDPVVPDNLQHQLNAMLEDPGSISKLCLSCHDGSVAVSSYGNFAGGAASSKHAGGVMINAVASGRYAIGLGGDLRNHHPIGFNYDDVAAVDDEIRDPSNTLLGNNPFGLTINDLLYGRKMECGSCHDVHNTKNTGLKFVWVEDTNSNFCFSCHAK